MGKDAQVTDQQVAEAVDSFNSSQLSWQIFLRRFLADTGHEGLAALRLGVSKVVDAADTSSDNVFACRGLSLLLNLPSPDDNNRTMQLDRLCRALTQGGMLPRRLSTARLLMEAIGREVPEALAHRRLLLRNISECLVAEKELGRDLIVIEAKYWGITEQELRI